MAEPIKLRVQFLGDVAEVRVLLPHPMDTGQGRDERGALVPAHFIEHFSIRHNDQPLIDGRLNTSVSRNPLFAFRARGIQAGDTLSVAWRDNLGEHRQDEFTVG